MKGKNFKYTIIWCWYSCLTSNPQPRWVLEAPFCIFPNNAWPIPPRQLLFWFFFCHRLLTPFLKLHVKGNTKLAFFSLRLPSLNITLLRFTHAMFIISFFLLLSIVPLYKHTTIFLCIFLVWRILGYCSYWLLTIKPLWTFCAYFLWTYVILRKFLRGKLLVH